MTEKFNTKKKVSQAKPIGSQHNVCNSGWSKN